MKRTALKRHSSPPIAKNQFIKNSDKGIERKIPAEKVARIKQSGRLKAGKALSKGTGLKIRKRSKEDIQEQQAAIEKMWSLFNECWNELSSKNCKSCGKWIGTENLSIYWHHLIPKSKFPEYKYEKDNLMFLCGNCHAQTEADYPSEIVRKATEEIRIKYNL